MGHSPTCVPSRRPTEVTGWNRSERSTSSRLWCDVARPGLSSIAFSHTIDHMLPSKKLNTLALAVISIAATGWSQPPELPPVAAPLPPVLQNYRAVTAERLKNPESDNWLMIRRTYDGWGYSPLDQITSANVQKLRPVWVFSTGETKVHEAAPLINNGVMFVSTPNNQVLAIDARTGNLLWRYRKIRPSGANVPHE